MTNVHLYTITFSVCVHSSIHTYIPCMYSSVYVCVHVYNTYVCVHSQTQTCLQFVTKVQICDKTVTRHVHICEGM